MLDFQWDLDEAKIAWQKQGENKGLESVASNMLSEGFSFEQIQKLTKLSIDKIKELAEKLNS